jgi:hypothetical protein
MKTPLRLAPIGLTMVFALQSSFLLRAATTISATNPYAYGANLGWIDARGDVDHGVVIGEYVCSGYLYAANVGWISLGSGMPANNIHYQNNSASDFGVNHDGQGNLRGYAYGANIGWINFEETGAPKVDLWTGQLSGHVWSANCGWISLVNSVAVVQTTSIQGASTARNGLPVPWLLGYFSTTDVDANADTDGDGLSNAQEYAAGTDPTNATSALRITHFTRGTPGANDIAIVWESVPTRCYAIEVSDDLTPGSWSDLAVLPWSGINNAAWSDAAARRFYRVRAFRPLME